MTELTDDGPGQPAFWLTEADDTALTPRGQRTRARLVEAARELLEDLGYPAATVTDITRRSGVSLGTFYRYFDNKEQLFLQLLRSLVRTLYEAVAGTWNPDDITGSLRDSTHRYLRTYHENRRLIGALRDMASSVPEAAHLWWELRLYTFLRMRQYLEEPTRAHGMDPDLVVASLGGMVEQFAYFWYVEGERYGRDLPDLDEAAANLALLWYRSVYADGA